ncbi:MAG: hypothetical protein ACRDSH_01690 [Pseudonocardiaceae bacterium]
MRGGATAESTVNLLAWATGVRPAQCGRPWSQQHVRALAALGGRYGLNINDDPEEGSSLLAGVRSTTSKLISHRPESGLLLLADLRHLHLVAAGVSLDWELLAQGAQAAHDPTLLALASRCHPQSLRQMRWANAMLKVLSPQVLVS